MLVMLLSAGALGAVFITGREHVQTPAEQRAAAAVVASQRAAADARAAEETRQRAAFAAMTDEDHLRAAIAAMGARDRGVAGGEEALRHLDAIPTGSSFRREANRLRHELEARLITAENQVRVRNADGVFNALIRQRWNVESVRAEPYNHGRDLSTLHVVSSLCNNVRIRDIAEAGDIWHKGFRRIVCERTYSHDTYTLDAPAVLSR